MTKFQVMSWNGIPSQVKAVDEHTEARVQLPPFFQQEIDRVAVASGLIESDAYLEAWTWSEPAERAGSPSEVAEAIATEVAQAWLAANARDPKSS